jgi:hypothetical protein
MGCEDLKFATNKQLKYHMLSVHEEEKPFNCNLCDYSSVTKSNLNRHVSDVHEDNRPFECEKCEAKYKSKPALGTTHILRRHFLEMSKSLQISLKVKRSQKDHKRSQKVQKGSKK